MDAFLDALTQFFDPYLFGLIFVGTIGGVLVGALPGLSSTMAAALLLPFTIAMTMPMAVLVATLYAFGRMAAEHEITAFKASGVRVRTLMAPVLACAFALSIGMIWFNDQVLPAANHRLRILQQDIARTKPTVALREQSMNMITEMFFMRVARVNAETNRIYDVVMYDLSKGIERKTIYADSGVISLDPNGRDMVIQLYDGFAQDERGIARGIASGRGPDIGWFTDPAGNIIAVLQNPPADDAALV